ATRDVSSWPYYAEGGYIGLWFISADDAILDDFGGGNVSTGPTLTPTFTPTPTDTPTPTATGTGSSTFPSTGILDDFNRANGAIGSNWGGEVSEYSINSNALDVLQSGSSLILWQTSYGPDQEAYVTLTNVDEDGGEHDLILKSQRSYSAWPGAIEVLYDPGSDVVQVWTYDSSQDWVQHGADVPVTFVDGDQLGARALADGTVEVYRNGELLATRDVSSWPYYAEGGYIGLWFISADVAILDDFGGGNLPTTFPHTAIVDDFNRANGSIGGNWGGEVSEFSINSNALDVLLNGSSLILWQTSYGPDQEAYVTFTNVDESGDEQDLILKSQSSTSGWPGAIEVWYGATDNVVQVWTYESSQGWVQHGSDIPVTFVDGDQFGTRARADGTVEVYRNGELLATRDVTSWPYYAEGGYIGLWFINAEDAILDDFGGGNTEITQNPPQNLAWMDSASARTVQDFMAALHVDALFLPPLQEATATETPTPTPTSTLTETPTPTPTNTNLPSSGPVTIDYTYDPLYRLTEANYSTGDYYHYTYDPVGNRLTQEISVNGLPSTVNYAYDIANRLIDVDGVTYTWDDNGNLLNDGVNSYTYDYANRLVAMSNQQSTFSYAYNGLGDRLQETANGVTTTFTMDLNTGLTQALSDGTYTYLYGAGRIAQSQIVNQQSQIEYFLGDALGSVRQLTDATGAITYARSYDPYGVVAQTGGASQTAYGYTGEYQDSAGLVYLRARHYAPEMGRFLTRDTWEGVYNKPLSLNRWLYVEGNPVNYADPSGHLIHPECQWMPTKGLYEYCILLKYGLQPIDPFSMGATVTGERGCYSGPTEYRAPGYLEGMAFNVADIGTHSFGAETVYDFATMERENFTFYMLGASDMAVGGGANLYFGKVYGFKSSGSIIDEYRDISVSISTGGALDIGASAGAGRGFFVSASDPLLYGKTRYIGYGLGLNWIEGSPLSASIMVGRYSPVSLVVKPYILKDGSVNRAQLFSDILTGKDSPWNIIPPGGSLETQVETRVALTIPRLYAIYQANKYAFAYEELRK
ncbi:MAG: RHS repeat-associated core domain-containing protein, partial [Anaerolineales bacterium]|nr:RHS repeat-associated core domain-containing protein [Anaerolineales bacterium]